jgi:hypothetical protein
LDVFLFEREEELSQRDERQKQKKAMPVSNYIISLDISEGCRKGEKNVNE